jgi:hypothetical protein
LANTKSTDSSGSVNGVELKDLSSPSSSYSSSSSSDSEDEEVEDMLTSKQPPETRTDNNSKIPSKSSLVTQRKRVCILK